ncbi:MAG: hypothetical protein K8R53_15030 [Bacteroidales bacterium]|nr:hypothetical protein [Bacteroidales bacterium]
MKLSEITIEKELDIYRDGEFKSIGKIPYQLPDMLVGCAHEKYLPHVFNNSNIVAIICHPELIKKIPEQIAIATCSSVRETFALIQNQLALNETIYNQYDGIAIGKECAIHPTAIIEQGVIIQDKVSIGPYSIVKSGTVIGSGSVIDSNVVLGIQGFEYVSRENNPPLRVTHAGRLLIGENVDIHPGTTVQRGRFTDTIIKSGVKIDAQVHIGHEVVIGNNTLIASGAMIAGGVKIRQNVWIGPMASLRNELTIGDNAYISIGSMVSRSVQQGEKVSGYFAILHDRFIDDFKSRMK